MSDWLKLLAELKQRNPTEYLTPTQKVVHDKLCNSLNFPEWINLYGKHGVGKTFVAWSVARAIGGQHIPSPLSLENLKYGDNILLIDNAPYQESSVRKILAKCDLLGAKAIVFITRQPVSLPMKRVELYSPNQEDIEIVLRTFERLGYYRRQNNLSSHPTLWDVLQACV